ncbi:MAG: hypothetical protein H7Z71_01810 [Moraxellaceae bacterium]|nr:hypothetical protein [Pseudobdellovibrionaceae bacterium]
MQKIILFFSLIASTVDAGTPPKPVALFLDCNIGTHYSNAILPAMKKRGEEIIVIKCKDFPAKMAELAKQNVYVKTLFASGHDGDGSVHGDKYGEDKGTFDPVSDIGEINKKYPKLFSQVQSYYPLGCYTTAPSNLQQYVYCMPNLKFVAGFYGAAHSAHRKVAQDYLINLLEVEDEIIQAKNAAEFNSITQRLSSLNSDINMGLYRNFACKASGDDYKKQELKGWGLTIDKKDTNVNQFVNFSKSECQSLKPKLEENLAKYLEYDEARLDIPRETSSGPLRALYSFFRQTEYCKYVMKDATFDRYPYGDWVFSLLFHRTYRENFKIWAQADLSKLKSQLAEELSQNKSLEAKQVLRDALAQIQMIRNEDMKTWSMGKINDVSVDLAEATARLFSLVADKKITLKDENLKVTLNKMSKNYTDLLVDRNAPLSWHEVDPKSLPEEPYPKRSN